MENGCLSSASRAPFLTILAPPGLSQNVRFEFHGELLGTKRLPEVKKVIPEISSEKRHQKNTKTGRKYTPSNMKNVVFVWEGYVFCIFHLGRENVPIWSPKWHQNGTLNPPESQQERPEEAKRHHGTPPNTTLRMHDFELQKKTKKYKKCSRPPPRDPPPGVPGGRVGKGLPYRQRHRQRHR